MFENFLRAKPPVVPPQRRVVYHADGYYFVEFSPPLELFEDEDLEDHVFDELDADGTYRLSVKRDAQGRIHRVLFLNFTPAPHRPSTYPP